MIYWGQSITQQRFLLSQAQVIYEWLNTFTIVEVSFGGKACCNEVTRCDEVRLVGKHEVLLVGSLKNILQNSLLVYA